MDKISILTKIGKTLLALVFIYVFVVPIFAVYIVELICGASPSEFCGLWIIVVSPHVLLFADYVETDFALSLPLIIGSLVAAIAIVFTGIAGLRKYRGGKMGFFGGTLLASVLFPILLFAFNLVLYPYPQDDWQSWANQAVKNNDPSICTQKIDPYFSKDCLFTAARLSQDRTFCDVFPETESAYGGYGSVVEDCLTEIALTEQASLSLCSVDYDPECLNSYCLEQLLEEQYYCTASSGMTSYYLDALAWRLNAPALCELYKSSPNAELRMESCKENIEEVWSD